MTASAGIRVRVTVARADATLLPQHPDAPAPELLLIRPDGVVVAASEPLSLDATGTSLASTLTMDGRYSVAARCDTLAPGRLARIRMRGRQHG